MLDFFCACPAVVAVVSRAAHQDGGGHELVPARSAVSSRKGGTLAECSTFFVDRSTLPPPEPLVDVRWIFIPCLVRFADNNNTGSKQVTRARQADRAVTVLGLLNRSYTRSRVETVRVSSARPESSIHPIPREEEERTQEEPFQQTNQ